MAEQSILVSIREKCVGNTHDRTFDEELLFFINSAFNNLTQIGVGPTTGFRVNGENEKWVDFLGTSALLEQVKEYVYLRVRVLFDPPASSTVLEQLNKEIAEREWRINITVDDQTGGGSTCTI